MTSCFHTTGSTVSHVDRNYYFNQILLTDKSQQVQMGGGSVVCVITLLMGVLC